MELREFADHQMQTLRLEAESADEIVEYSAGNSGGAYRAGDLDIGRIPSGGWFVGWTEPGCELLGPHATIAIRDSSTRGRMS